MNPDTHSNEPTLRKWYWAFAIAGSFAAFLFAISYWEDYDREWRQYQRTYASELKAIMSGRGARDFVPPGFVYHQVLVTPTHVDRCQICHRGIDDPRFVKSPQPLTTHPKISSHPFEKFGCTVCHMGQGRATTVADAHGQVPFWDEPMLRKPFVQANCGTCHRGVRLKDAPLLARGRTLYLQSGCIGCHRVHGVGGTSGPELTWVGERRKDPEWHLKHFRNPRSIAPGTTMPPYGHLPKRDLNALTVYMLSLRRAPSTLIAAPGGVAGEGKNKAPAGKAIKK